MVPRMIPRLPVPGSTPVRATDWPVPDNRLGRRLYAGRMPYRKMVILVDADVLETGLTIVDPSQRQLLTDLLDHELLQVYRYADDGPPASVAPDPDVPLQLGRTYYQGWAVVSDFDAKSQSFGVTYQSSPGVYSSGGIIGNAIEVAEADSRTEAYRDLAPDEARKRRRADALASQVARQAIGADIYVTERPYLHKVSWSINDGVTICNVAQALAAIGFYFRSQGVFPIANRHRFNRGLFLWVGTRELLPEGWRWFTACVQSATGAGDDSLMILGGSVFQRVQRALEARDAIHLALNQEQHNDTQQEALSNLDLVLVLLMAAVDVTARVAHRTLGLGSKEYEAAWQKDGWIKKVKAAAPDLANVVAKSTDARATLEILRLLRNSLHGAALQGLAAVRQGQRRTNLVGLPQPDKDALVAAMQQMGGLDMWGVRDALPGRVHLDPGEFVDRLFGEVMTVLNELMRETPVEQLPHVSLAPSELRPPGPRMDRSGSLDTFHPGIRTSIRWQLGL